jgi:probable F420-dependent oxidoreductase
MRFHGIGIWTAQFDFHPAPVVRTAVQELEELGYGSLWIGENVGREPISQASILLAASQKITIALGVVNIWARDPLATVASQYTLSEAHPDRFVLGLGASHTKLVNNIRGHQYQQPLHAMTEYLTAMDQVGKRYRAVRPLHTTRVLGALGPRMLGVAASQTDGAHTYLVTPQHTAAARAILGPDKLLVPEQAVILDTDKSRARELGRRHLSRYLPLRNYTNSFLRMGFTAADFEDFGSDRLVDAVIAWGDEAAIAERVTLHMQAGADHVCLQILDPDFRALPLPQWRNLATIAATNSPDAP